MYAYFGLIICCKIGVLIKNWVKKLAMLGYHLLGHFTSYQLVDIRVAAWNRWLFEKLVSINENFYSSDLSLNRYGFGNVGFIDLCYVMVFNFVHYLVGQDSR